MQRGSVGRHGDGWRARWREHGHLRSTRTVPTKGEAARLLHAELDRLAQGERYMAPITFAALVDRFLCQYAAAPQTILNARRRLQRPLAAFAHAQAADVTTEAVARLVAGLRPAYRRDVVRTLRMVYRWGIDARLVDHNPARLVAAPKPARSERMLPFTSWQEVERVAAECGRWAPLVVFMADSGARPAEAVDLEWRHVDLQSGTVELPGHKTDAAWRTVHLTPRGLDALTAMPRSLQTRRVFHVDGRAVSFDYFRREVWHTALQLAGLEPRPPYALRHTFAFMSLAAGVPIASLARQMGHTDVNRTFATYGGWAREMGADAAALRSAWAARTEPRGGQHHV